MSRDNKRLYREKKRQLKQDGNRQRRRHLQRELEKSPDTAHEAEFEFNDKNTSTQLNGMDHDQTRKKDE